MKINSKIVRKISILLVITLLISNSSNFVTYAESKKDNLIGCITRLEWAHYLVEEFNMEKVEGVDIPINDVDKMDSYYDDVVLLIGYGVATLDDNNNYNPEQYVTRQFAADTLYYCLGYQEVIDCTIRDIEKINNPNAAKLAISHNWFELIDGNFDGNRNIIQKELVEIKKDVEKINYVDNSEKNIVEAKENVLRINESTNIEFLENDIIKIDDISLNINAGDSFIAYSYGIPVGLKANNVEKRDDSLYIKYVKDNELYENIDVSGKINIDPQTIQLADNVKMVSNTDTTDNSCSENRSNKSNSSNNNQDDEATYEFEVEVENNGFSTSLNFDDLYSINVVISNLSLNYDIDEAHSRITLNGNYELSQKLSTELSIPDITIGKILIAGIGEIEIALSMSTSGEINYLANGSFSGGVEGNSLGEKRIISSFDCAKFSVEAKVNGNIEIKISGSIDLLLAGAEIYIKIGTEGHVFIKTTQTNEKTVTCIEGKAYIYCKVGAGLKYYSFLELDWKSFASAEASIEDLMGVELPNVSWHLECIDGNWNLVDECSLEDSSTSSEEMNILLAPSDYIKNPKINNYDDGSDIVFDVNEHRLYSGIKLYCDLEIDGDVYIDLPYWQSIDLNGYTLTINGNVYHKSGCMFLYQTESKLIVNGNYYLANVDNEKEGYEKYSPSQGRISMYRDTYMDINGDFITYSIPDRLDGTNWFENVNIEGDLYQLGNSFFNPSQLRLDGTNKQKVYYENPASNLARFVYFDNSNIDFLSYVNFETLGNDCVLNTSSFKFINSLNLWGHSLTINGDFVQDTGVLIFNGKNSKLTINGNYYIAKYNENKEGRQRFTASDGAINTINIPYKLPRWIIDVNGDFVVFSKYKTTNKTTSSVSDISNSYNYIDLYVAGDFYQYSDSQIEDSKYNLNYIENVILDGNKLQNIVFDNPGDSYIKNVTIKQPISHYNFSSEACYKNLICGEEITTHLCDNGTVIKQPTCTEKGIKQYKCNICNIVIKEEEIAAKGHTVVEDGAVEATCTQKGKTAGKHCTVCNEVLEAQNEIAAKGHTIVEDGAVEATCTQKGKTAGKHCAVCNEIIVAQEDIPALGHSTKITGKKRATYFEKGYTGDCICVRCNDIISNGKSISKIKLDNVKNFSVQSKKNNQFSAKWRKNKNVTGYQIQYLTGKQKVKTVKINKNTKTSYVIKNLISKKTYKVRIRTYKIGKVNGKLRTVYSNWSAYKKIKVK